MRISKRQFCKKYNIEPQLIDALCAEGALEFKVESRSIKKRIFIDDSVFGMLEEGVHYVSCPKCGKRMACVTEKHNACCNISGFSPIYSSLYMARKQKTEEQKVAQSRKLIERFKTSVGEETRKIIGQKSREMNADPEFKRRKSEKSREVNNRPEVRLLHSVQSKKMWSDPKFRAKMKNYALENIEVLKASAQNARKFLEKQSKLHIGYKTRMLEAGLTGFISEYAYGPYSLDEADPLAKIAIEIDGCYWHGCLSCGFQGEDRIKHIDKRKTSFLRNRGWVIIRIKEHELKQDPKAGIECIRTLQEKRREVNRQKIISSMLKGKLTVQSMENKDDKPVWRPLADVLRHNTPHKRMFKIITDTGSVVVTEDHSLFGWPNKEPIRTDSLKFGDLVVGLPDQNFGPVKVMGVVEQDQCQNTYDVSVPDTENAVTDSGILVHNTYSISGVSLDIEKSSKYQSMKDEYIAEYDKLVEAAKRSIKIIKGLRQMRYGIGITSALGPLNRPGVQSRRNWIEPSRPMSV
jgi:very-short-patch-repair endonuclease